MRFERASVKRTAIGMTLVLGATVIAADLSGCASRNSAEPQVYSQQQQRKGFFGLGRKAPPPGSEAEAALGVNSYLWRAALDTISFMPLASADPYGGLIITDWYANPEKADERFKATVYILDTRLRADGLNVALQKQVRAPDGSWRDAAVSPQTETDLENAILTKARQLRVNGRG